MTSMNSVSTANSSIHQHSYSALRRRGAGSILTVCAPYAVSLLLLTVPAGASQNPGSQPGAPAVSDALAGQPVPALRTDDFRYTVAVIGDVNSDRVSDLAVADATQTQVAVFSGATGSVLYVLDLPNRREPSESGPRLAGAGDVNGDRVPDIAVEQSARGPVALFSGVDGTFLSTQEAPAARAQALPELGRVAGDLVIADVNGDGVADIAVGGPSDGQVLIFSGADGSVLRSLQLPWAPPASDPSDSVGLASCIDRVRYVQAGDWRTLETFWNVSATGYFRLPAGAQIKVRYGVGWFSYDSQKKTLDGITTKTLRVGSASILLARMQMKFSRNAYVYYTIC